MGAVQAQDEGLEPTKEWVKDLIDEIVAEEFASPDLELAWLSEDENDSSKAEAALEARVKIGAVTLNELRAGRQGLQNDSLQITGAHRRAQDAGKAPGNHERSAQACAAGRRATPRAARRHRRAAPRL